MQTPDQNTELFGSMAALAGLDLSPDRALALAVAAAPIHALLRTLSSQDLGETPPATAFKASWK